MQFPSLVLAFRAGDLSSKSGCRQLAQVRCLGGHVHNRELMQYLCPGLVCCAGGWGCQGTASWRDRTVQAKVRFQVLRPHGVHPDTLFAGMSTVLLPSGTHAVDETGELSGVGRQK